MSEMEFLPVICFNLSNSTSSQDGTPLIIVIGCLRLCSARRMSFSSQSLSNARWLGGNVKGARSAGASRVTMPLKSPEKLAGPAWRRSVLPPRKKRRPVKSGTSGWAARNQVSEVSAAFRLDASIARETGMYLVVPEVVPDDSVKYG